jgi:hypothetical protein
MMELGVDGTFKRRLKPDATTNVHLASPDPEKKKRRISSCSTPTHSQESTTEASKGQSSLEGSINTKFHHSQRIPFKTVTGEVGGAQSVT